MNELDKTLRQQLDGISDDVIQDYLDSRKAPEIQIGELVHYWDGDENTGRKSIHVYEGPSYSTSFPYQVNGFNWAHIARPVDFPEIRIPYYGNECPVDGEKIVTVWHEDGFACPSKASEFEWDNRKLAYKITHYLVHRS